MTTSTFVTRQRSVRAAALLTAFAGLVACSGSPSKTAAPGGAGSPIANSAGGESPDATTAAADASTPAAAHGAIDPCSLLTDAEAGAEMGGAAKHETEPAKDGANGSGLVVTENRCTYTLVTSSQLGYEIHVGVYNGANRDYFDQTANDSDHSPFPGLGDAATAASNEVYVFSKGTMVEVYGSVKDQGGMQGIAKLAIAKL